MPTTSRPACRMGRWVGILLCVFLGACAANRTQPLGTRPHPVTEPERDLTGSLAALPVPALLERGRAHLAAGNYPLGELHFAQVLKTNPDSQEALLGIAECLRKEQKNAAARGAFEQALSNDPNATPALLGLGRVSLALGDAKTAIQYLARAKDLAPDNPEVLTELALAFEASGKETLAEPLLARVTELQPNSATAYNNKGFNFVLQKRFAEAVPPLERALQLAPSDRLVLNNLGLACAMTGQDERAFQLFERSVGKAGAYNNLGYVYMTKGDWQKAEQAFNQAMTTDPKFYTRAKQNLDDLAQLILQGAKKDVEVLKGEAAGNPGAAAKAQH